MNKLRIFSVLVIFLFSTSISYSQIKVEKRLDQLFQTFFNNEGVGCATLISQNGKIIYQKGFGNIDIELGIQAKPDNVFRIGSITKQFTAIVILQLYEQGKLDLKDEIQKYFPDFPNHEKAITIENLLTHTSGIKNITEIEGLDTNQSAYSVKELIDLFKDKPLDFLPGEKYRYSNSGYILLGGIIEKISGQKYADYLQSNIFDKLGMTNSFYDNSSTIIKKRAKGYDLDSINHLVNASYLNTTFPYSAGGLVMTTGDYFKWHQAIWNFRLIKKETLQKALTPYKLNDGTFTEYGYGWALGDFFGSQIISHGGSINGFQSKEMYLPKEDILVVVFSNGSFINCNIICDQAAAIASNKKELDIIDVPSSMTNRYIGTYQFMEGDPTTVTIFKKEGKLYLKDSNVPTAWEMHFIKDNEFICYEVFPNTHLMTVNSKGETDGFTIKNHDHETKLIKLK